MILSPTVTRRPRIFPKGGAASRFCCELPARSLGVERSQQLLVAGLNDPSNLRVAQDEEVASPEALVSVTGP